MDARTPEGAVRKFKARLRNLRCNTSLFDEPSTIYLDGIIELNGKFTDGVLLNFVSYLSPEPGHIHSLVPNQTDHELAEYGWGDQEAEYVEPFLDFGGKRFREALKKATQSPTTPRLPQRPPALPKSKGAPAKSKLAASSAELDGRGDPDRTRAQREALTAAVADLKAKNRAQAKANPRRRRES